MSQPLVSILIPAFNAERWIAETLESAVNQTWPRTEVIVVDDGSTDQTAAIVRRCASASVRLIAQGRRGPSAAQNEAFRVAQGDFIQRLDADDLLSPDKVERQMTRIAREPGAIAVGEWARFYGDPREAVFGVGRIRRDVEPAEWLLRECAGGGPMLQPGLWLAPRAVVEAAGPWNEHLTLNNDFEYFVRVILASRVVHFTEGARLYYRSGNPASLASVRSATAWQSQLRAIELGTAHLIGACADPRARSVSADLFQGLAFDAYLEDADVSRLAEAHATHLGGSSIRMGGGAWFRLLERALGWKGAKHIKKTAYEVGYGRIVRGAAPAPVRAT